MEGNGEKGGEEESVDVSEMKRGAEQSLLPRTLSSRGKLLSFLPFFVHFLLRSEHETGGRKF